ncbi:uncharacterized protein LOC100370323 [Saccoglossus kowalevskii]|uniref:Uncharacterized protein LOC100370323 n=1 Tax=Saccoglossus kowalevskii TaxID=10224 RepID=A0ABM0GY43_SACKO|nr:PREDICTED: uncharacterized protein LOC100370323 [Saccoglossus kowalevskii]
MDIGDAIDEFRVLLGKIKLDRKRAFLDKLQEIYCDDSDEESNEDVIVQSIAESLRAKLPLSAQVDSECIMYPTVGHNGDCETGTTLHVDKFLYDDDAVETLCDEGTLHRYFCQDCGSHNVHSLTFISHSCSIAQLKYIFKHVLPSLREKIVVDVGSRLGAVLYGGYFYSDASKLIGIEINSDLCKLQQEMIATYQMQSRIQIICADVVTQHTLLQQANVIILNNVFEFFASTEVQNKIWRFLYETVRQSGCLLLTVPSLEQSLLHLQTDIDVNTWVKPVLLDYAMASVAMEMSEESQDELKQIFLYEVL